MQTEKKAELDGWRATAPGALVTAIAGVARLVAKFVKFAIEGVLSDARDSERSRDDAFLRYCTQ